MLWLSESGRFYAYALIVGSDQRMKVHAGKVLPDK
jgi:hypothetical protein